MDGSTSVAFRAQQDPHPDRDKLINDALQTPLPLVECSDSCDAYEFVAIEFFNNPIHGSADCEKSLLLLYASSFLLLKQYIGS